MDDLETNTKFRESLNTPFPLLSDVTAETAKAYGVYTEMPNGMKVASRVTFIIGKDGKVVKVFEGKDALDPSGALSACKAH